MTKQFALLADICVAVNEVRRLRSILEPCAHLDDQLDQLRVLIKEHQIGVDSVPNPVEWIRRQIDRGVDVVAKLSHPAIGGGQAFSLWSSWLAASQNFESKCVVESYLCQNVIHSATQQIETGSRFLQLRFSDVEDLGVTRAVARSDTV